MTRRLWSLGLVGSWLGMLGCSSHPSEGTVVEVAPGVPGAPGGAEGVSSERAEPISGGTLAISGSTAVASDPERDRIFLADLGSGRVREIETPAGAEPGRVVVDDNGRAHVALRRAGQLLSIDLASGQVVGSRSVCPAPRGIAFDSSKSALHVACDTGELVTLPVDAGAPTRSIFLGRDLRDVVVQGDALLVTKFRSAELLTVDATGQITSTRTPPQSGSTVFSTTANFEPSVAWRTVPVGDGRVAVLHQRANPAPISIGRAGYYTTVAPCATAIVHGTVSVLDADPEENPGAAQPIANAALPLVVGPGDVAVSPDGQDVAVVSVGNSWAENEADRTTLVIAKVAELRSMDSCSLEGVPLAQGEHTSVAYTEQGQVVVQSREPATLEVVGGPVIQLSDISVADTGTALFHMNSGFGIACASCHPEGREDGRVWDFVGVGPRRTQSFAGGLMATAPFHWSGDVEDLSHLVHEVFVSRMGGPRPNSHQIKHFSHYLDRIPAPAQPALDGAAVARGHALFNSDETGCADCHAGNLFTNNRTFDVGTGGFFQVPSLVGLDARAPFMHDGCATTLDDRFEPCGGSAHGQTSHLQPAERHDLVQYLRSL